MSNSTVTATIPAEPLFESGPPLLVVPALIGLALCYKCTPKKPWEGTDNDEGGPGVATRWIQWVMWWAMVLPSQFFNVFCTFWVYTSHYDQPLMLNTPAYDAAKHPGSWPVKLIIICTGVITYIVQLRIAFLYLKLSNSRTCKMFYALNIMALMPLGSIIRLEIIYTRRWPESTFMEQLMWTVYSWQNFVLLFAALAAWAFYRLRKQASEGRHPQLNGMSRIAFGAYALASLMAYTVLFGHFCGKWLELAVLLLEGSVHWVELSLMNRIIAGDTHSPVWDGFIADPIWGWGEEIAETKSEELSTSV